MNLKDHLPKLIVVAFVSLGVAMGISKFIGSSPKALVVEVTVPALSPVAQKGKKSFDVNCASCHGPNASGTDKGPPLIHNIYNPGHHGDGAFQVAAQNGVRAHHWPYGNMPPQPQVKQAEVSDIIRYVREVQMANGIRYQQHKM